MQLKTSFFNLSVLRKNVTRFAPVWMLYGILWLLILVTIVRNESSGYWFASSWGSSLQFMPILNFIYAFFCAQMLFGDLYTTRMCNSLHAFPMRREGWFFTHVVTGLLFSLVPNLVVSLLSVVFLGSGWVLAPIWLLGTTLQFIFFFGVAALSAYCVGNRFAMLLVYGLINGLSILVYALLQGLYIPLLHGFVLDETPFVVACPLVQMCSDDSYVILEWILADIELSGEIFAAGDPVSYTVQMGPGWGYLCICAGIGILCMALALFAYRKRNLETAGDFLSVQWLRPVFLLFYCLCAGMGCYLFFSLFVGEATSFFLIMGLIIGWFTGKMLLERTVRVFGKVSFLGCGILVVAMLLSLWATRLDILGVTQWMPAPEQIHSLTIEANNQKSVQLKDAEAMEIALELHRYGIENPAAEDNGLYDMTVELAYTLKSGKLVRRQYAVDTETNAGRKLKTLFSRMEHVLESDDPKALWDSMLVLSEWKGTTVTDKEGLYAALEQDAREGNLAQGWGFHRSENPVYCLEMTSVGPQYLYRSINVYESCVHTIAWMEAHGYQPLD